LGRQSDDDTTWDPIEDQRVGSKPSKEGLCVTLTMTLASSRQADLLLV